MSVLFLVVLIGGAFAIAACFSKPTTPLIGSRPRRKPGKPSSS